jgi:prepilin-type processing-associated H-X9-DG protein
MILTHQISVSRRFTLVELVVVITVVATVVVVGIPALFNGAQKAKLKTCAANQKKLGELIHMYTHDNGDFLPAYENGWVQRIGEIDGVTVDPGVEPEGFFACPSQEFVSYIGAFPARDYWRGTYYGMNQHITSNLMSPPGKALPHWTQVNRQRIKDPSSKLLMADASGSNYFNIPDLDPVVAAISRKGSTYADGLPDAPAPPLPAMRHVGGSGNFLFVDSHVEDKTSWPELTFGPGTSGFDFWHGGHAYPGSSY